jgi:hypothetical protein
MDNNFKLEQWTENDVRIQKIQEKIAHIFKGILGEQLRKSLIENKISIEPQNNSVNPQCHPINYFTNDIDCEILKVGSNSWQKGKFKINVSIEFISDEPEKLQSELDTLRQEISN